MARKVLVGLAMIVAVLAGSLPVDARPASSSNDPDVIAGSWIVTLVDNSDPAREGPALARQYGGEVGHIYQHALKGFSFKGSDRAAANLSRNHRVVAVEADRVVRATGSYPTGVLRIDGDDAHTAGHTGEVSGTRVRVAILDTGIQTDHPDLSANILRNSTGAVVGKTCISGEGFTDDGNGHGTHVAGTVAAVKGNGGVIGVAHRAQLIPVKVLSSSGSGSWESVTCGVDWVTANASTIRVANMSLGGSGSANGCDSGLHKAICNSVAAGVTYAVAAGNDSKDASGFVPAAYPEVITVSAFSDLDGTRADTGCVGMGPWKDCDETFARFSNYGSIVDVIAPGVRIYSTDKNGTYSTKSGTSMASPHVAGVAALVIAKFPTATPADVEAHLKATGECPNQGENVNRTSVCQGQGTWNGDPDGIPEPMVNALWAASATSLLGGGGGDTTPTAGTLSGLVTDDADPANPIEGATVAIDGTTYSATTGPDGSYTISDVPVGDYTATASASGYDDVSHPVSITDGGTTTQNFALTVSAAEPDPEGFTLSATGYKVKGLQVADLTWSGASSTSVDVYRDGAVIATTANDGAYTDNINNRGGGSYTYQVCEAGTSTCSNEATVTF